MNHDQLKRSLGEYACIAYNSQGLVFTSKLRGVAPLAELCELNTENEELYVADKVVGKAAALLCAYCNVKMLYAAVISEAALEVLASYAIDVSYTALVPYIKNRSGDGKCPMEQLSSDTDSPEEMYRRVKEFLENLQKN